VPLQCLWRDSITLISTLLLTYLQLTNQISLETISSPTFRTDLWTFAKSSKVLPTYGHINIVLSASFVISVVNGPHFYLKRYLHRVTKNSTLMGRLSCRPIWICHCMTAGTTEGLSSFLASNIRPRYYKQHHHKSDCWKFQIWLQRSLDSLLDAKIESFTTVKTVDNGRRTQSSATRLLLALGAYNCTSMTFY